MLSVYWYNRALLDVTLNCVETNNKHLKERYKIIREEAIKVAKVGKNTTSSSNTRKIRPAITPEARENQLISLAIDLVEQRLIDGTASSQETTHFLKLGSSKAMLEKEKLAKENELLKAKTEALESAKEVEKLYKEALKAMREYSGNGDPDDY